MKKEIIKLKDLQPNDKFYMVEDGEIVPIANPFQLIRHNGPASFCKKPSGFTDWYHCNTKVVKFDSEGFEKFKNKVSKESKKYPSLKSRNGEFNETYLIAAFNSGQTPTECCNSMTEEI